MEAAWETFYCCYIFPCLGERLGNGIPKSSFWKCCHGCDQDPSWHSNGLICFSACPAATSQSPRKGRASIAECQTDLLRKKRDQVFHIILMVLRRMNKRKKWGAEGSSLSRNTRQLFTWRGCRREREMNSSKWKATTATMKKNNPAEGASGLETEQRAGGGCACGSFLCTMSTPASHVLESRGTSDYCGQQYTTQSQTLARSSVLPCAKAQITKPAGPSLVVRQGHQTEWPHLHPAGSIAAFLQTPSIFSTALQHGFYW